MTEWQHLLLLPGLLCDDRLWQPQVDALSEITEIVIADMTRDDTLAGMVARPLDAMPGHFALAGLSMGGYAAFEIMRQAPERVTRLALLDTGSGIFPYLECFKRRLEATVFFRISLDVSERRYNNADQQVAFSSEKGFEFVPQMVEKELIWGLVQNNRIN